VSLESRGIQLSSMSLQQEKEVRARVQIVGTDGGIWVPPLYVYFK